MVTFRNCNKDQCFRLAGSIRNRVLTVIIPVGSFVLFFEFLLNLTKMFKAQKSNLKNGLDASFSYFLHCTANANDDRDACICFLFSFKLCWHLLIFSRTGGPSKCRDLNTFILVPIPLFILMGDISFHSGMASNLIETVGIFIGRIPGRLAFLVVAAGVLLSTLTGTSLASVATLGSALVPYMRAQGYKSPMILGPILGSGGLAMLIPPSALAVLCGAIAEVSIAKTLLAIIVPGLVLAGVMSAYIVVRCLIQKDLAPAVDVEKFPFPTKIVMLAKYVLP